MKGGATACGRSRGPPKPRIGPRSTESSKRRSLAFVARIRGWPPRIPEAAFLAALRCGDLAGAGAGPHDYPDNRRLAGLVAEL